VLGIDTNVLVRYLVRDDQQQFERARRLINRELGKGEPVLVSLLVLLETEWVLRSRYSLGKTQMLSTLSALLEASDLVLEDEPAVEHAIYSWKESAANFSDCLINARNRRIGCSATATFDRNALKVDGFMAA
jgi:predicted nucleic-acid-binding protein